MKLFDLTGKIAIVTGSSRGIGKATAERLAEHGARVVVSSRKQAECEAVAASINATRQGAAIAVACDITQEADRKDLAAKARAAFGAVDILVCNAGGGGPSGLLTQVPGEGIRQSLEINLVANILLIQEVVPDMIAKEDGAIILVTSTRGLSGSSAESGGYSMAKAAEHQLARTLALELGPKNIRVNCVAPGFTRTELSRQLWEDPERRSQLLLRTPLKRVCEPDDIAGAIVFLSGRAGAMMTGETMIVDGGKRMA